MAEWKGIRGQHSFLEKIQKTAASAMGAPLQFSTGGAMACTVLWIKNCKGGFSETLPEI